MALGSGASALVPLSPDRYIAVSLRLKESLVRVARGLGDPAAAARSLGNADRAHREREAEILRGARTTAEAFRDFSRVRTQVTATRRYLAGQPVQRAELARLDARARDAAGGSL